ncbi:MAG: flagellar basal body rod C-terminal domain-containing protein, partial [Myxococcota bacterium]|nr:flagellar basal body rod C-terminal domain-containing protein [Myxococcota bacterium]
TDTAGMTITKSVGGQLGALLKIRDEDLEEQKSYLDDVAFNFANAANTAHGNGFDMDGNAGVDLFTVSGTQAGSAISLQVNTAISNAADPARLLAAKAAATNGNGDGTVAEQIADLDEALLCATGTKTVYQQVNLMVTKLGQLVRDSEQSAESAESRHIVLSDLKDAAVGVSIEEEMVALQTYQKSFQAASRIIRTIDEMMGTLVNM